MDYFKSIRTLKLLKLRYRELCKLNHPDLAADPDLCVKIFRTIIHSYANKYLATGQEIVDMVSKL